MEAAPSKHQIRAELEDLIVRDLLGPHGGLKEELPPGMRVGKRYLLGHLAPKRKEVRPEELDNLAVDGQVGVEDGRSDSTEPATATLMPSSIGLSVKVAPDTNSIAVTARWGHYLKGPSEYQVTEKTERPATVYRRHPRTGTIPLPLKEGAFGPLTVDDEQPDVVIKGRVRKRSDGWSVTVFLVNDQEEKGRDETNADEMWVFQPEIQVAAVDAKGVFLPASSGRSNRQQDRDEQAQEMLYRLTPEFAVGHGVAVHAAPSIDDPRRALRVTTTIIPSYEVAKMEAPKPSQIEGLDGLDLDMRGLAEMSDTDLVANLRKIPAAYKTWIEAQQRRTQSPTEYLTDHAEAVRRAAEECNKACARINAGIDLLTANGSAEARLAFRFMNQAMALQRLKSIAALTRRRTGEKANEAELDVPKNRSWRTFQIAFILMNLAALADPTHPDRSSGDDSLCDLLWFPTGGGKTEAYLGLAAFAMAIRRLQGDRLGLDGRYGVAVLMRYTLRLLTLQQFQRATALICAMEVLRREAVKAADKSWGEEPFRIGLWVGQRTTPNKTADSEAAIREAREGQGHGRGSAVAGIGTPGQLTNCPWCGASLALKRDYEVESYGQGQCRTLIYCPDDHCQFTRRSSPREGIPAIVVDEEIFRRLPALVIATVDKFAQMPWNGPVQMLFGQVNGKCPRHGFRSPDIEDSDTHPATSITKYPKAKSEPCGALRPPDLIIQDELHLISGPLGTLVGLYETAIDGLMTWKAGDKEIRPKVIASTATIRRAGDQITRLFNRRAAVFPPSGVDAADNFFARREGPSPEVPGRRYLGICAHGRKFKSALIRVFIAEMRAAQFLFEKYGPAADPWMTMVGYFNSLRELGGTRRMVDDDIRSLLRQSTPFGMPRRNIGAGTVEELTSRLVAEQIPEVLDRLELGFSAPEEAQRAREKAKAAGGRAPKRPIDVLLATNMISVGVDIDRLGIMLVAGQPKTTAEYIQASSRVGRSHPGLVLTVYNWARPRDLSHYETFEHYHQCFYKHVEALTLTPFAARAVDRGLAGVFMSLARMRGTEFNANDKARALKDRNHQTVRQAHDCLVARARSVTGEERVAELVEGGLKMVVDTWLHEASQPGRDLVFKKERGSHNVPLLAQPGENSDGKIVCLNSLRDVEPSVAIVLKVGTPPVEPPYESPKGS
jgi:hypothetical protein